MTFKKITSKIVLNDNQVNSIAKIIAIGSGKGGVGKSTVAANLAVALAKLGNQVGLLDADIYGPTQAKMFGDEQTMAQIDSNNKITPIMAHGVKFIAINSILDCSKPLILRAPIVTKLIHALLNDVTWGYLDYLLIDLPPGTGDIQLSIAQQAKLDGALIVTTPQEVAINIAQKGLAMFQRVNVPIIGVIENMAGFECTHCHQITNIFAAAPEPEHQQQSLVDKFAAAQHTTVIAKIPLTQAIATASDQGKPLAVADNDVIFSAIASTITSIMQNGSNDQLEPTEVAIRSQDLFLAWGTPPDQTKLIPAYQLRINCKCALCVNENTGAALIVPSTIPSDITVTTAIKVGRYGLKLAFSDSHNTGIYTYTRLLEQF